MNIPLELIVAGLAGVFAISGAVIAFVFRVVFGLISKNEHKSDEADVRIEATISAMDDRYRSNDRELYQKTADSNVRVAKIQAQIDCIRGSKS